MKLSELLVFLKLVRSKSEAKRKMKEGAVKLIRDGSTYILRGETWTAGS